MHRPRAMIEKLELLNPSRIKYLETAKNGHFGPSRFPWEKTDLAASIEGDRRTLFADAAIPATMAVIYLLLLIYFKAIGGYKVIRLAGEDPVAMEAAKHTGEG